MSQRRSALGRGLGALISNPPKTAEPASAPAPGEPGQVTLKSDSTRNSVDTEKSIAGAGSSATGPAELDISLIDPNPEQPRREFDPASLQHLADSIGQHGVLQPVVVRQAGPRFELVMGERRFRASQLAGRKTLPAVILEVDPADRLELAIVENVQREDLNPIELALAYQALADAGHTQEEIGQKVAMDRSSIANHIRLLELSRAIQTDLEGGRLSMGHAKALLQVSDPEMREALRARILSEALSVRAAERTARELNGGGKKPETPAKPKTAPTALDADTRAYIERIERRLQTKVHLQRNAAGGGKIEINFFNLEDLERIGSMLLGEPS